MAEHRMDLDDALAAILADTRPVAGSETVATGAALGRVLAQNVDAPLSLPPFPASAMDGYALRSADAVGAPPYRLPVSATSLAGRPLAQPVAAGTCVRIFTGAAVPDGLDAVVIQENCRRDGDVVLIDAPVRPGDNVRPRGHDVDAGERVLSAGRRLNAFDIGRLAASGLARVEVHSRPRIGIFSTGDELVDAPAAPGPGQIFDANRATLHALLQALPVEIRDFGIVGDDREAIRTLLEQADATCDAVITSGGVSVGDADWVKAVVEEIGTIALWRLNLKPGKPLAYGRLRRAAFFGLPGNPVSTIVTALLLARPALERLSGTTPAPPPAVPATLLQSIPHQPGREEFQRGTLRGGRDGLEVAVTGDQSSNRLASFAEANCLIRIPKDEADLAAGSRVTTLPFAGVV